MCIIYIYSILMYIHTKTRTIISLYIYRYVIYYTYTLILVHIWSLCYVQPRHVPCQSAPQGSSCWNEVQWAMTDGIRQHPEWYPGLNANSPREQFQEVGLLVTVQQIYGTNKNHALDGKRMGISFGIYIESTMKSDLMVFCWLASRSFCSMLTRKTIANINSRSVSSYSPFKYSHKVWASGPQNLFSRLCTRTVPGSAAYLVVSWVPTWVLVLVWALASPSRCWTMPRARTDVFWSLKQNTRRPSQNVAGSLESQGWYFRIWFLQFLLNPREQLGRRHTIREKHLQMCSNNHVLSPPDVSHLQCPAHFPAVQFF